MFSIVTKYVRSVSDDIFNKLFINACDNNKLSTVKYLIDNKYVDPTFNNNYALMTFISKNNIDGIKYLIDNKYADPTFNNNYVLMTFISKNNIDGIKYIISTLRKKYSIPHAPFINWRKSFMCDDQYEFLLNKIVSKNYFDIIQYFMVAGIIDMQNTNTRSTISRIAIKNFCVSITNYVRSFDSGNIAQTIAKTVAKDNYYMKRNRRYLVNAWKCGNIRTVKYLIDNDIDTGYYHRLNPYEFDNCIQVHFTEYGYTEHNIHMRDIFYYLYDSGMFETALKIVDNCKRVYSDEIKDYCLHGHRDTQCNTNNASINLPGLIQLCDNNDSLKLIEIKYKKYINPISETIIKSLKSIIECRNTFRANLHNMNDVIIVTHNQFIYH